MMKVFSPRPPLFTLAAFAIALGTFSSRSMASDREERAYDVDEFTAIYLEGPFEVLLSQGGSNRLTIEAPEDIFADLDVEVDDGLLSIEWDGGKFKNAKNIKLWIGFEDLEKLEVLGAVDLEAEEVLKVNNLKLEFEGAGDLELDLEAGKVISEITGVGTFVLRGTTEYHKVEFSGVGKYDARELHSQYTLVESNGVGTVKVHAAQKFIGEAHGVGSVDYYGDPSDVTIDATGIGSIDRK